MRRDDISILVQNRHLNSKSRPPPHFSPDTNEPFIIYISRKRRDGMGRMSYVDALMEMDV